MGTLVLNGATSGSTTLQPTDATTQTITFPSGSGTVLTTANRGSGSIVQVVNATYATETGTTSTSYVSTGLTLSITPTSATSKIFVIATFPATCSTNGGKYTIYRNAANVVANGLGELAASGDTNMSISYLDSPATTSATTYTMYMKNNGGGGTTYFATNSWTAVITAFEVAV